MHPLTAEWTAKAEADFAVMEREGRVRKIRPETASASMLSGVRKSISKERLRNTVLKSGVFTIS